LNTSHKVQKLEQNKGPTQKKDEIFQVPSPVESSQQYVVEEVASNRTQKEVVFPLAEEGEMQVDDKSEDNVKKRKARDEFQISGKMGKLPLHGCSQAFYSDAEVGFDADSIVSSQSLPLEGSGYSMLSIKKFEIFYF